MAKYNNKIPEACGLRESTKANAEHVLGIKEFRLAPSGEGVEERMRREMNDVRKRQEKQHGVFLRHIFKMGRGQETWDVVEAANILLKRELPEVDENKNGQSGKHVVPPFFISECVSAVDYAEYENKLGEGKRGWTPQEMKLRGFSNLKVGEPTEKKVYEKIKEFIGNSSDEVILFHGAKLVLSTQKEVQGAYSNLTDVAEKDFVLINKTLQYVLSLEVKKDLHKTSVRDAMNQTTGIQEELEQFFVKELNKDWKMVKMVYGDTKSTDKKKGFSVCTPCDDYVVVGEENIIPKLGRLNDSMKANQPASPTPSVYRTLVKYLLFCIHANPGPILKSTMLEKTEQLVRLAGRADNIALWSCWTLGQNSLMRMHSVKYVVLPSSMSTGKTECIGGKSLQLAFNGEKVLIIVCNYNCPAKTMLHLSLQKKFRYTSNVKIEFLDCTGTSDLPLIIGKIQQLRSEHPTSGGNNYSDYHIFVDELILPKQDFQAKFALEVEALKKDLSQLNLCLWIAIAGVQGSLRRPHPRSAAAVDRFNRVNTHEDVNTNYMKQIKTVFKTDLQYGPDPFYLASMKYPLRSTRQVTSMVENMDVLRVNEACASVLDWAIPSNMVEGPQPTVIMVERSKKGLEDGMKKAFDEVTSKGVAVLLSPSAKKEWILEAMTAAGRKKPIIARGRRNASEEIKAKLEESILEWMEDLDSRPDLVVSCSMSRGWEEQVVIAVDTDDGRGTFGNAGPEDQYIRTISKLIVVKCCPKTSMVVKWGEQEGENIVFRCHACPYEGKTMEIIRIHDKVKHNSSGGCKLHVAQVPGQVCDYASQHVCTWATEDA